jgi:hypothetical protein
MNGVEILAAQEVVIEYAWNWSAYFITIGIVALFGGLIGLAFSKPLETFQGLVGGVCVGVLFGAIIGVLPASITLPDEYETHYKVTISDEVAMNDFLERYEILDKEGRIYTVRERDGVEDGK